MKLSLTLLFLQLWGNMELSLSQNAQHCPLIHVDSNVQLIGDPERANYGSVVRFRCKSSFEFLEGSAEMYCDENGQWIGTEPKCTDGIKCRAPVIANGVVLGDVQKYKEHQVLHYQCDPQYKRAEERQSKCTKVGTKAEWSPTPACESIKCEVKLPALEGTRYEPAFRNVFLPGDTLRVLCGEKHWIVDHQTTSAETTCQSDGKWSIRPLCHDITCKVGVLHPGLTVTVHVGEKLQFDCSSEFQLDGSKEIECLPTGQWSAPIPTCL
ncbi:C4b-binding protein-like [Amphiprion ocellaris]|uniref:C4b-binding protein-like n=1 Tax=Amphiprion ocellaris TaxID=80972 RepID=UPI002410EBE0|nr:C4b-binding protein-like [Amphiprion ocellaris]